MIGRCIQQLEAQPHGQQQLGVALEAAWDVLAIRDVNCFINSMNTAIITARGGHTRYRLLKDIRTDNVEYTFILPFCETPFCDFPSSHHENVYLIFLNMIYFLFSNENTI